MENLESRLNEISIDNQNIAVDNKWGMPLKDLYRLGLNFYKGMFYALMFFQPTKFRVTNVDPSERLFCSVRIE